jgi:hypothetical protein
VINLDEKESMKNYFDTVDMLRCNGRVEDLKKLQESYRSFKEFSCNKEVLFLEEIIQKKSKWNIRYGASKSIFVITCNKNVECCIYWKATQKITSFINTRPELKQLSNENSIECLHIANKNEEEFLKLVEQFEKENENDEN